jgi:hypothetical protein
MATIDNTTFRALNGDAEIFPGKANYWVIVARRSDLLEGTNEERLTAADQVVADFMRRLVIPTPELRALDAWKADGVPTGRRYGLVQPQPMTYPEGSVFISLTWDAKNPDRTSVPWPWVWRGSSWQDVQEGLVSIHQPGSIVDVPGPLDNAVHAAGTTAAQMRDELPKLASTALVWVAVGAVSLFALGRAFR